MKFKYQAKTKAGESQVGNVEAASRDEAVNILTSHDLFILSVEETGKVRWYDTIGDIFNHVSRKDMMLFTRQFAMLLEADLPLKTSLQTLKQHLDKQILKEAVGQIGEDVDSGLSLSQSMGRQPAIFSEFFVSMIQAAEVTGNLKEVSMFLADYTEKEGTLSSKAISAMIYPAIIVGLFAIVVGVMLVVVFPQITPVFEQAGVQLPLFSRILIGLGKFLSAWWPVVAIGMVIAGIFGFDYFKSEEGRALLDDAKIHLPIVRKFYMPLVLTRFSNSTAFLLKGGIPIAQALEIVGHTVDNVLYQDVLHDISNSIREGELFSTVVTRYGDYFPPLVAQMLVVGEATGRLDQIFMRLAAFYGREADTVINNIVDLIQPMLLVVIGLFVALLFGSILLPLYHLTSSVGG